MMIFNAQFGEGGAITCEVDHPELGRIPFTARATIPEDGAEFDFERDVFAAAKAGTVAAYVPPPPPTDHERTLSPRRFEYLLALTGFGEIWDQLAASVKDTDRAQYAALMAEKSRSSFNLGVTLGIVAKYRTQAAAIAPDVDLSEAAIRAAWDQAETFAGLA